MAGVFACARAYARMCARVVRACVRACVRAYVLTYVRAWVPIAGVQVVLFAHCELRACYVRAYRGSRVCLCVIFG